MVSSGYKKYAWPNGRRIFNAVCAMSVKDTKSCNATRERSGCSNAWARKYQAVTSSLPQVDRREQIGQS